MSIQNNQITETGIRQPETNMASPSKSLSLDAKPKLSVVERLKWQQQKLASRIQQIESRQRESERKQETRRKILVGAYYLDAARRAGSMDELNQKMVDFLTRDSDKALFGLYNSNRE